MRRSPAAWLAALLNALLIALLIAWPVVVAMVGALVAGSAHSNPGPDKALLERFGPWPQPVPPDPGNQLSGLRWAEVLGEQLFDSTVFSGDNSRSCATCHDAERAFTDGLAVSVAAGVHVRNSQGLLDVGQQRWFGWDGGADSLWAASMRPILSDIELDGDIAVIAQRLRDMPGVMGLLVDAGHASDDDEALVVTASKAIAAYLRTLQSGRTAFDRYRDVLLGGSSLDDDYPDDARRGMATFFGEGKCHLCHFGPNFSNREFHDTGRPFFTAVGQVDPGRYAGILRVRADRYNLTGPFAGSASGEDSRAPRRTSHLIKFILIREGFV